MKFRSAAGFGQLALALCLAAIAAHAQTRVTAIEHQASKDRIRIILHCQAPVQYVGGTATNPARIFFDLNGARPAAALARESALDDSVVQRVRVALNRPGVTRMVLDLAREAPYTATFLSNPPRLVVEVMREGTGTQARALASPPPATTTPPHRARMRTKATPEPVASALLAPPPPPAPLNPEQMPPVAPQVIYRNGLLSIVAENSTLSDILHAVGARTGATVEAPPNLSSQRVAARLGPAAPREVLADLLSGLDYIVVGASSDPDAIRSIVVSNSAPFSSLPPPKMPARPPVQPPEPVTEPEPAVAQQPPPQTLPQGESNVRPPQAKTPEELLEELRKLQEQQGKEPAR